MYIAAELCKKQRNKPYQNNSSNLSQGSYNQNL